MKKNIGSTDKIIRILLGTAILGWGLLAQNWLGLIGLIPLGTAFIGTCPAYLPLGVSTKKIETTKIKY